MSLAYSKKEGWDEDPVKILVIQTVTVAGVATGALTSGIISHIGRLNCLILANFILDIGVLLTLIEDFEVLCIGRFLYGVGAGSFSVFGPLYVSETSPIEVSGPLGASTQIGISTGVLLVFSVGMGIGDVDFDDESSFEIRYYWYIIFLLPIAISLI